MKNLNTGSSFDYKNKTWKITEVYKIKWDDGDKSVEYKVKNDAGEIRYLEIAHKKKTKEDHYSFWGKVVDDKFFFTQILETKSDFISLGSSKFPKIFTYQYIDYLFEAKFVGTCTYAYETEKVNSLDYVDKTKTKLLSIELWDDEIEISTGKPIDKSEITNLKEKKVSAIAKTGSGCFSKMKGCFFQIIVTIFMIFCMNQCDKCSSSDDNNSIYRSSGNSYRSRSSGFGK